VRIGITGHAHLSPRTAVLVRDALAERIAAHAGPDLVGVTCLCEGADQIFARVVLESAGGIEVILPSADYRSTEVTAGNAATFDDLLSRASSVLPPLHASSSRQAYKAASVRMISRCDLLVAVWDGEPSRNEGDTADVVASARSAGRTVVRVWPPGAVRTCPEV
jgi:hypothetical protein